jgi:hypothetical protein
MGKSSTPTLLVCAAIGAALVALRGIAAVVWPAETGSPTIGIALVVALAGSGALFVLGLRTAPRRERPRTGEEGTVPWLARATAGIIVILVGVVGASLFVGGSTSARHRWTFLGDATLDALGFRVGAARGGTWTVEPDRIATGARALVNRVGDSDAPPATLVTSLVRARDLRALTRCRVSEGGACGLVFRYLDDRTHHLARLEAGRVVLARVRAGGEHILAISERDVATGIWHELSVEARGDAIRVSWNGQTVVDVHDPLAAPAGAVGLWAPAGSEAYFDELAVEVLPASPQAVEVLPFLYRRTS